MPLSGILGGFKTLKNFFRLFKIFGAKEQKEKTGENQNFGEKIGKCWKLSEKVGKIEISVEIFINLHRKPIFWPKYRKFCSLILS